MFTKLLRDIIAQVVRTQQKIAQAVVIKQTPPAQRKNQKNGTEMSKNVKNAEQSFSKVSQNRTAQHRGSFFVSSFCLVPFSDCDVTQRRTMLVLALPKLAEKKHTVQLKKAVFD